MKAKFDHFDVDGLWADRTLVRGFVTDKTLKRACAEARELFEMKLSSGKHPPFNQPASILKRAIYQFGIIALNFEQTSLLMKVASEEASKYHRTAKDDTDLRKLPRSAPKPEENPFYYAFYIAFPNPSKKLKPGGDSPKMTHNERAKTSKQLVYAYRNKVRPQHLICFIYQTGGSKIIEDRLNGEIPEFSPLDKNTDNSEVVVNWSSWRSKMDEIWPWPANSYDQ